MPIIKFSLCVLMFLYLVSISGCSAERPRRDIQENVNTVQGVVKNVSKKATGLITTVLTLPAWKLMFFQKLFKKLIDTVKKIIKAVVEIIIKINTFKINTIANVVKILGIPQLVKPIYEFAKFWYDLKKVYIRKAVGSLSGITDPYKKALAPITDKAAARVLITLNWVEAFVTGNISHCSGDANLKVGATKALIETKFEKIKGTINRIITLLGFEDIVKEIKGDNIQSIPNKGFERRIRSISPGLFENYQDGLALVNKNFDLDNSFVVNDKIIHLGKLDASLKPRQAAPA